MTQPASKDATGAAESLLQPPGNSFVNASHEEVLNKFKPKGRPLQISTIYIIVLPFSVMKNDAMDAIDTFILFLFFVSVHVPQKQI